MAALGLVKGGPWLWMIAGVSAAFFTMLFAATLKARDDAFWLASAAVSVAGVSLGFGILSGQAYSAFFSLAGPRYNYIPLVLLGLCYLCLATRQDKVDRRTPRLMVAVMLFVGAIYFAHPTDIYAEGPSWKREVALYQADHNHQLYVWPYFKADLSDRHTRCDATFADRRDIPRYCEAGWLTSFDNWKEKKRLFDD